MRRGTVLRLAVPAALLGGAAVAFVYGPELDAAALARWVERADRLGPMLFVALFAAATVLFLPGSVLTLMGGALFGPVWGTLFNLVGATLGATLAFLVARHVAADWVARRTRGRLRRLVAGVEAEGWRFVAFTRLVPLFPFNLLNYALGLTRIGFWPYAATSFVSMLPATFAYTWLGHAGRHALQGGEDLIGKGLLALALLALVAFLPRLVGRFRKDRAPSSAG